MSTTANASKATCLLLLQTGPKQERPTALVEITPTLNSISSTLLLLVLHLSINGLKSLCPNSERCCTSTVCCDDYHQAGSTSAKTLADQEVFGFAKKMLQIFALALGLEETALDETFQHPMTDITMQYYPIQHPREQSSIMPHVDYGGLTFLYQGLGYRSS